VAVLQVAPIIGCCSFPLTDLRHTAVAQWIAAAASPKEASVRAGHTSVSFTLDRYGHLYPGSEDAVNDRLDAMVAEGRKPA
jgi:integrase